MKHSIDPKEIEQQRQKGWVDFHPEDYCHRCGGKNLVWYVDSDRWNLADPTRVKIMCPGCFAELHEEATGLETIWKLIPDPQTSMRAK